VRSTAPAAIGLKRALHDAALVVNPWTSRTADPRSCLRQMSTGGVVASLSVGPIERHLILCYPPRPRWKEEQRA
jgi:hypothetical protein